MRILALDSALARCSAGLVTAGSLIASRHDEGGHGQAGRLPWMIDDLLRQSSTSHRDLDLVAVTVGPGSFTGIRAALAVAHGLAAGAGIPVIGVTVGEALADSLPHLGGRAFWATIDSRRGRVFLERAGTVTSHPLELLPLPVTRLAIGGDAAPTVAAQLAAAGADVMLTDARLPNMRHLAAVAKARHLGALAPLAAYPLYVDPPMAALPAGGLRPAPA